MVLVLYVPTLKLICNMQNVVFHLLVLLGQNCLTVGTVDVFSIWLDYDGVHKLIIYTQSFRLLKTAV